MKQNRLGLNLSRRMTLKQVFLAQMQRVVPWAALVELIAPFYPEGKNGRPPFMQQWFSLSDTAMEEAFFGTPLYREFAQIDADGRVPDESTMLRFGKTPGPRHRLEKHKLADQIRATVNDLRIAQGLLLKAGTAVDATLIAAPSRTKNKDKARDPGMHSSQKGRQWHFGMKAHTGVDTHSGLEHTVRGTSGHVAEATEGNSLLHGKEAEVFGDAGHQGADKCKALDKDNNLADALINQVEKIKAGIQAKVEHPFRVVKRLFSFVKVRDRGLKKNTLQLKTLFALSNLWMVRHTLMKMPVWVRPKPGQELRKRPQHEAKFHPVKMSKSAARSAVGYSDHS